MVSLRGFFEPFRNLVVLFQTVFLSFWSAFLLPAGMIVAIAYGGWLYFGPFVVANVLIAYKLNKARRTGRRETYDDKKFSSYDKSLEAYAETFRRSRDKESKTKQED